MFFFVVLTLVELVLLDQKSLLKKGFDPRGTCGSKKVEMWSLDAGGHLLF